jgi:hypothetical protein
VQTSSGNTHGGHNELRIYSNVQRKGKIWYNPEKSTIYSHLVTIMCEIYDKTNIQVSKSKYCIIFIHLMFNDLNYVIFVYFISKFYIDVYQCDSWNKFLSLCCELHRRYIILSYKIIPLDYVLLCINNLWNATCLLRILQFVPCATSALGLHATDTGLHAADAVLHAADIFCIEEWTV